MRLLAPEEPLRCGRGTFVCFHKAVSDGESPARSPLGPTWVSFSVHRDLKTLKTKELNSPLHMLICRRVCVCVFSSQPS